MIHLDTHVVAWLFSGRLDLIPDSVQEVLEDNGLEISPMVYLELDYLYEIGRVTEPASVVFESLREDVGLEVCSLPFGQVVRNSHEHAWTRDPFDRLIVSQADLREVALVTKDRHIHEHYSRALWSEGLAAATAR